MTTFKIKQFSAKLLLPILNGVEGVVVGDIIHKNKSHRTPVVGGCYCPVTFLTCRVLKQPRSRKRGHQQRSKTWPPTQIKSLAENTGLILVVNPDLKLFDQQRSKILIIHLELKLGQMQSFARNPYLKVSPDQPRSKARQSTQI